MNIYFKKNLGMTDAFMLTTWDELDRINKVCDDYFIYRGYAADDECTGYYTVLLYDAKGYCVLDYPIGSSTVLLTINTIEFMNSDCMITFRATGGDIYTQYLKGGIHEEDLIAVYKCVNSVSGLAECRVDNHYNVLMWRIFDDDKNRQDD